MFKRSPLDEQIQQQQFKPPRHPFVTLAAFVVALLALGAVLVAFGLVRNTVPVAVPDMTTVAAVRQPAVRPEHWRVRMLSGSLGVVDDPRVAAMVWQDFVDAYTWLYTTGWHADYASAVSKYFMDGRADDPDTQNMASGLRAFLDQSAQQREFVQIQVLNQRGQIANFSADGLKVSLSVSTEGTSQTLRLDTPPRLLNETPIQSNTRTLYTLRYDAGDKRWKIAGTR